MNFAIGGGVPGMICFAVAVLAAADHGGVAARTPRGNNVCTRVKSVTEVHRVPMPGTKTQTTSYTTKCGLQGHCSRYRIIYVQNYRELRRTIYRVIQECCAGLVQRGRRCVTRPSPDTAAGAKTTLAPTGTDVTGTKPTDNPSKQPPTRPVVTRDHLPPGTGVVGAGEGGRETAGSGGRGQGVDAVPTAGRGAGGQKGSADTAPDNRPGRAGVDDTSNTRNDEGVLQDGAKNKHYPEKDSPDTQLPHRDSGMMFLNGMMCGVGVLSAAAFVVLFLMYRQRRHLNGRIVGMPFLQSTRFGSGSFRKSKLLALAQSIRSGEVKLLRESTVKGDGNDQRQYANIEVMQERITFTKSCESAAGVDGKESKERKPSIRLPTMMALNVASSWSPLQNERQLPPKPPTYAIIKRLALKGQDPEGPDGGDPAASDTGYSTVYATPDDIPKGGSNTIPRDFNMGPPRYMLCESQHIYADIHRKSKASTWSCSKNSRPKSSASTGDTPRRKGSRSARSLSQSLSRNSLESAVKRGSHAGSSGYSSLRGSKDNIFYTYESVEERSGPPSPNIYSETIPKEPASSEHYDRLDLSLCDSYKTEYDKLRRGPKTSRGNGIVKTFSKKYEKLASMSKS